MFLTPNFLAESIGSAAMFFLRRFGHGLLAMAAFRQLCFLTYSGRLLIGERGSRGKLRRILNHMAMRWIGSRLRTHGEPRNQPAMEEVRSGGIPFARLDALHRRMPIATVRDRGE